MPIKTDLQVQNYEFSSTPFSTADVVSGNYLLTVIGGSEWTGETHTWAEVLTEPADWSINKFQYGVITLGKVMSVGQAIQEGYFGSNTDPTFNDVVARFSYVYAYRPVHMGS